MNTLFDDRAILDDEEDDESFDEETGDSRRRTNGENGNMDDSSEEEDDDDEEAAAEVAEGFIDDEDEDELQARRERRRERKKRRREEREREDEGLDEEDLELIGIKPTEEDTQPKFKRLKRGPREDKDGRTGVDDIFGASDDEDDLADRRQPRLDRRGLQDEFLDFIEEDVFSDEEQQRQRDDEEVARPRRRGMADFGLPEDAGLDEQAMEDFREAFGDGTDYDFALLAEEDADAEELEKDKHLDLKDVFEPSQLAEKMLTDEDNAIRFADEPERHQIARKAYKHIELSETDFKEEAGWISGLLWAKKQLPHDLHEPFRRSVAQVLGFLVHDDYEVPFIFQNRKDYLIHAVQRQVGIQENGAPRMELDATKLLNQTDIWSIFEHDLKFRALVEKRQALRKTYSELKAMNVQTDQTVDDMLPRASTIEELQDIQEYLHFQYASQLKDLVLTTNGETNGLGLSRKKAAVTTLYEEIRAGRVYGLVRAFGITADAFAKNALNEGIRTYAEDPTDSPESLADNFIDDEFPTSTQALKAARSMFVEELTMSPRLRLFVRKNLYLNAVIDCHRTEKGLRRISEDHPYYEFKYLRNQDLRAIASRPDLYLRMLKAEEEGLVEVKVRMRDADRIRKELYRHIVTDAYSTVADAWNDERKGVVSAAFDKLLGIMSRTVKENLKNECEDSIVLECRDEFSRKLDQAPYQPRGMKKGTTPRVLTLSLGNGISGRDPVSWAFLNDDGRVLESGRFVELSPGNQERNLPDGKDVAAFVDAIQRREPEVIGLSGWSPETRRLMSNIEEIIKKFDLRGPSDPDEDDDRERSDHLEVVLVNDEVARIYQTSRRAKEEHPGLPPLTLYCVGLGKYLQDPLRQYASLGPDMVSITFLPSQQLLPAEKLNKAFETALVDYVNLVGVDLEDAAADPAVAKLLPYVAGLGPRKAAHLLKSYNMHSNDLGTRESLLIGDHAPLGPKVWANAASSLIFRFDQTDEGAEFLDNTRIHPEDYDIARKMAADALELDEEDIQAETKEFGPGAIVRRLVKEDAQDHVNDLELEEYAVQLEKDHNAKKRSTLENIRAELNDPFEEIRSPFIIKLTESEVFTMLTHETRETLQKGMNVPMQIKRVTEASVEGKLDSGIDAFAMEGEAADPGINPKSVFVAHQTVQVHILSVDRKSFMAVVSLKEDKVKRPFKRFDTTIYSHDQWDDREESNDRKMLEQKTDARGRVMRVIKHPLFRPFNAKQAEEYLGSMNRGDLVIRPSSKGHDHLAVTWKVANGVFQHIDVLELDKENEFTLGKVLRVGGKHNYSDLDELIVLHVKAMAKKVEEMMNHEKFQDKSKAGLDEWLTTYTNANPKRSMYQFCINREKPGNFHLCFKAGQKAKLMDWNVKVIPSGFQLMNQPYPDMRNLCNGFKLIFGNMQNAAMMGPRR